MFLNLDKIDSFDHQFLLHMALLHHLRRGVRDHYIFNIEKFVTFMKENNYILVNKNRNSKIKFINFNNFKKEYKHLFMYDLMFKKK